MKKICSVIMLVLALFLAACNSGTVKSAATQQPVAAPKAAAPAQNIAPAQSNTSVTLARGNYSRPLGGASQSAAPDATTTEAPKVQEPQELTEIDFANLGTVIDWPLDEKGQVGGAQVRFGRDMDLSAIPWIVEVHVEDKTVTSVRANQVGTVWISPALRPALNKLVDAIESKKGVQASAAAPKAATVATNANPSPQQPAAVSYKGPRTALEFGAYGKVRDLLVAKNLLAGALLEADSAAFARLDSLGVDCRGENPAVQSCWIPESVRPLKDDRPDEPVAAPASAAPVPTLEHIGQGHFEFLGRVTQVLVEDSVKSGAVVQFGRTDLVSSYAWIDAVTVDGKTVSKFEAGQTGSVWVKKTYRPVDVEVSRQTAASTDKKKNNELYPPEVARIVGNDNIIKPLIDGNGDVAGYQAHVTSDQERQLNNRGATVQGSDGNVRSIWVKPTPH